MLAERMVDVAQNHEAPGADAPGVVAGRFMGREAVGSSDSRLGATSGTRPWAAGGSSGVTEAGIDTARILYRVRSDQDQDRAAREFDRGRALGPMRAGYTAAYELLWVEGRPSTVFDPGTHALLPAGALPDAQEAIRRMVRAELPSAVEVGVSRVDCTASVRFDRPADGWAMARGIAAMRPPRREVSERFDTGGRPRTLYLHYPGSKRVLERIYDKGHEAGSAPEAMLWRFEAQTRHPNRDRTTAEHWTMERVREQAGTRFRGMAAAAEGLHVRGEAGLRDQLRELVEQGSVTPRHAELLLGHLAAESVGIKRPRRTRYRRAAELRRLGLAMAMDGYDSLGGQDVDVDLGAVLDEILTTEKWSA